MTRRIRIVSDLHIGHHASLLSSVDAIRPLAQGVDRLILNGDTLELIFGDLESSRYTAAEQREMLKAEIQDWGVEVTLITGNHDPDISDTHLVHLEQAQVLATHGDALFHEIAPWSSSRENLRKSVAHIDPEATGSTQEDLHQYLDLYKKAMLKAHKLDKGYNPTAWGKAKIFMHQAWPPSTPFKILSCWKQVPDRAISLAKRFGLLPRFIVIGHSHNPGIWTRGAQTVINTGSCFPWPGARCVDIDEKNLTVRRLDKARDHASAGEPLASFPL